MNNDELKKIENMLDGVLDTMKKTENLKDIPKFVNSGYIMRSKMSDLEIIGTAKYLLDKNVNYLRSAFKEIGELRISLFERYDAGEGISESYITMRSSEELQCVLVAGVFDIAERLAKIMGGRDKLEKQNDLPFTRAFGYSMKYLVLDDKDKFLEPFTQLLELCQKTGYKSYLPYAKAMLAIMNRDEGFLKESFLEIKKGYKRVLARDHPGWSYWPNYLGIALANLAIYRGMKVEIEDEFIPGDLLIG